MPGEILPISVRGPKRRKQQQRGQFSRGEPREPAAIVSAPDRQTLVAIASTGPISSGMVLRISERPRAHRWGSRYTMPCFFRLASASAGGLFG